MAVGVFGLITTKLSAASTDGKAGQESTKIHLVFFYCLLQAGLGFNILTRPDYSYTEAVCVVGLIITTIISSRAY